MRRLLAIAAAAFAVTACGGGDDDQEPAGEGEIRIALVQQNGSGQDGEAVLAELDERTTQVEITLANPRGEAQPAHIHRGNCDRLEPQPEYALENVVDGNSTSQVNAKIDDLLGQGFAINVHKSEAEVETYVACGDIASGPGVTKTNEDETRTETDGESSGSDGY